MPKLGPSSLQEAKMPDVVVSEFMDEVVLREVLADYDVVYDPGMVDDRSTLLQTIADARAIIVRNRTQVDVELLDGAPALEIVGRLGVGLDNIDLDACAARGIKVCPATGANDLAVAEYAITAALILLRGVWSISGRMVAGEWPRTESMGREASGKRFGLIGFGAIARQVAARARALGMAVAACDPYLPAEDAAWEDVSRLPLETLVENSDVISIHVPLTDETRHLVDARLIKRMSAGTILVNTSRGGVVDEGALITALQNGHLGGAGLDVFENEPLGAAAGKSFEGVPNLLLTPHIAGITDESNLRVSQVTAENVLRHLKS
jgi:(S)-sulfolactate dehydrogenase